MSEWRDCKESFPVDPDDYIVFTPYYNAVSVEYWNGEAWDTTDRITHWMPFPTAPNRTGPSPVASSASVVWTEKEKEVDSGVTVVEVWLESDDGRHYWCASIPATDLHVSGFRTAKKAVGRLLDLADERENRMHVSKIVGKFALKYGDLK